MYSKNDTISCAHNKVSTCNSSFIHCFHPWRPLNVNFRCSKVENKGERARCFAADLNLLFKSTEHMWK